eukprot:3314100-Lingulodinium_polyedra.AAC.1
MRSGIHSSAAVPRILQRTHSMRRPPCGGRRAECVRCDMRGAAAAECFLSAILSSSRARVAQKC